MLKDDDYNVFKRWAKAEGYNLDDPNLSWGIVQRWVNNYEVAKIQDTWNYRTALHKERMGFD